MFSEAQYVPYSAAPYCTLPPIQAPPTPVTSGTSSQSSSILGSGNSLESDSLDSQEFPEIAYVTDEVGNILSLQEDEWNLFISRNSDVPIPPHIQRCMSPSIIGRNLFEFISDEKVQAFARHLVYMLCSGQQQKFQYYWFCDAPEVERKMYMTVTALTGFGGGKLVLWVSKIITEKVLQPQQNYLKSPALSSSDQYSSDTTTLCPVPTNTVCSFCKRIMVLCEDISPETVKAILSTCTVIPKPLLSQGPIPILGLRGKLGEQVQLSNTGGAVNHLWLTPHQYYVVAGLGDNICIRHGVCEVCYNEIGYTFFPPGTFSEGVSVASALSKREKAEVMDTKLGPTKGNVQKAKKNSRRQGNKKGGAVVAEQRCEGAPKTNDTSSEIAREMERVMGLPF
ncbi:hypothetical protein HDU67_001994 [Dinochytrium kinnereticum]|nr:hypothetical protein HDU67_001994 [Dinochytrium kinnereticum]